MAKKFVILIIIILFLIGGGFFWWWQGREIKGSPEDYVIKETAEGKIVENKKAGLKVKVPEGWEAKRMEALEGSVVFYSPNIKGAKRDGIITPPLEKGCIIETSVIFKKMSLEQIKEEIRISHLGLRIESEEFEEITINNYQTLKNTFNSEVLGPAIIIGIPEKNKVFGFDLYFSSNEKEKCIQEFNKFLETVSIK